ncbi:hypothetical protein CEXT_405921 [Caerostris extrusa]|uniref:Uncharacterized protein n=1 Tax=Caerostris extrusa TaxID=172846 RepID=A0AAV4TJR3_CAEEX|nr:hypothetical protein CEXT_405921 [Caerostris extrusa]
MNLNGDISCCRYLNRRRLVFRRDVWDMESMDKSCDSVLSNLNQSSNGIIFRPKRKARRMEGLSVQQLRPSATLPPRKSSFNSLDEEPSRGIKRFMSHQVRGSLKLICENICCMHGIESNYQRICF